MYAEEAKERIEEIKQRLAEKQQGTLQTAQN
jgi:hypothetical protein